MNALATIRATNDRAPITLGVGLAVSLLLHAGAAWWLGLVPGRELPFPALKIEVDVEPLPDPLRLGMDIPQNASIAWLGVLENPIEAAAPESQVDQAELSPMPGAVPVPDVSPTQEVVEPVEEPAEAMPPIPPVVMEPVVEEPVRHSEPEPRPPIEPPFELPVEPEPAQPEPVTEEHPVVPPEVSEPSPAEPEVVEVGVMGPPAPTPQDQAVPTQVVPTPVQPTPRPPTPEGAPGELDERASDAAMRRTARELPIDRLGGRPLQASGDLQLTTVRPTWSLQVRNAYSPRRNPFIEIRFGADGRVRWARFVPLADGTEGSGYEEVDQPLLNAVFRWTARGRAIEALREQEPGATHDIVMRFLLVSAVPGERDEE